MTSSVKKASLASLPRFKNRCYVCWKTFGKGFTFHHLNYIPGEPTYKDFTTTEGYNEFVLAIVEKYPTRFLLLCTKHHFAVEQLKKFGPDKRKRLLMALKMSK